jgi:hypothetical protein
MAQAMFGRATPSDAVSDGLLFGAYREVAADEILLAATGQSLSILHRDADFARLRYTDADCVIELDARFPPSSTDLKDRKPPRILIDLRGPECAEFHSRYGLWRRVSWFLLDAVLVWFERDRMPHCKVGIIGGWVAGHWEDSAYLQSEVSSASADYPKYFDWPLQPYEPTALDLPAPHWRFLYLQGEPLACEIWLETRPGADGQPVLDETTPLADQIGNAPRFVSDDGKILFFHRVIERSGLEYAAWGEPSYGIVGATHAYYLVGGISTAGGEFIRRHEAMTFVPAIAAQTIPDDLSQCSAPQMWLHPLLREEQFFARLEASRLALPLQSDNLPAMCSRGFEHNCKVGSPAPQLGCSPISVGLPGAQTKSLSVHVDRLFESVEDADRRTSELVAQYLQQTEKEQWWKSIASALSPKQE